jgi:hypothetical protein
MFIKLLPSELILLKSSAFLFLSFKTLSFYSISSFVMNSVEQTCRNSFGLPPFCFLSLVFESPSLLSKGESMLPLDNVPWSFYDGFCSFIGDAMSDSTADILIGYFFA